MCFARIEGCQLYNSAIINGSKNCANCNSGFFLRNGICFYKDINCLEYDWNGNCIRCGNSLVSYYDNCVYYDPYCFLYDQNGICNQSLAGFSQNSIFGISQQTNYRSFIAYVRNIQSVYGANGNSTSSGSAQYV
jgi:hypothetical protein